MLTKNILLCIIVYRIGINKLKRNNFILYTGGNKITFYNQTENTYESYYLDDFVKNLDSLNNIMESKSKALLYCNSETSLIQFISNRVLSDDAFVVQYDDRISNSIEFKDINIHELIRML